MGQPITPAPTPEGLRGLLQQGDVSSSHGRLVARMLGAVSRAESERLGERVGRAHRQAREAGLWRGAIPLGMKQSAVKGQLDVDPAQAELVGEIFNRVLRGEALTAIARDFTARGLRPRRGKLWTHTGIARLIASPALGGMIRIDGELIPAAFDGLVTSTEWRDAQAALRRRPRFESTRPREKLTLLGGIMTCQEHGHVLIGGGAGLCWVSIKREPATAFIERLILARLTRPDAADLLRTDTAKPDGDAEGAELRRRRDDLVDLIAEGLLTAGSARTQLADLTQRLAALELQGEPQLIDAAALRDPAQAWAGWTMPQRRSVVRLLFDSITLRHAGPAGGPVQTRRASR